MLTNESWADHDARRTRTHAQIRAQNPTTPEHAQRQNHLAVMTQLQNQSPVSRRPYFWAQGGSADMFSQAVARNMVAISKEKHSPDTKQGPGPLLTPNEHLGLQMVAHREQAIQRYHHSLAESQERLSLYNSQLASAQQSLDTFEERKAKADPSQHQRYDMMREWDLETVTDMRANISELSQERRLNQDKLDATQQTQISWPGKADWNQVKKRMRGSASKLVTLGHGNKNLDHVSEELVPTREDQLHKFGTIVQSQIDSGLPLDSVAKRLDACHGAANPMNPTWVPDLQTAEREGRLTATDRSAFLKSASSTQKLAQAYQDRGVKMPDVRGVTTTMARFPNTQPNPTYINEVDLGDVHGRAPRKDHAVTHQPIFKLPPQ
ncbi:MAG: hypothetical protein AAF431_03790 [Pseudomonadota bacterium]